MDFTQEEINEAQKRGNLGLEWNPQKGDHVMIASSGEFDRVVRYMAQGSLMKLFFEKSQPVMYSGSNVLYLADKDGNKPPKVDENMLINLGKVSTGEELVPLAEKINGILASVERSTACKCGAKVTVNSHKNIDGVMNIICECTKCYGSDDKSAGHGTGHTKFLVKKEIK